VSKNVEDVTKETPDPEIMTTQTKDEGKTETLDIVTLKNGDRISGKVLDLFNKTVRIKAYSTGAISIAIEEISSISTSDKYQITLNEGTILEGTFIESSPDTIIVKTEVGEVSVKVSQIVSVDNLPAVAQKALDAKEAARFALAKVWKGRAALGLVDTTGNSKAKSLSMDIQATRKTDKDKIFLDAHYNKNSADGITSADYITGGGRIDIFLNKNRFYFLLGRLDTDKIKLLDLRATIGAGIGLTLHDNEEEHLDMGFGMTYVRESYEATDTESERELLYSLNYKKKLGDGISFDERLMFLPNVDELSDFRIESTAGIKVALKDNFGLNLGFLYRYDKTPPAGSSRNDATFTTAITKDF
jgi:putative salt-induced outer membrane protein YdiY